MRKQRLDILVHILTSKVIPDYRCAEAHTMLGFSRAALSRPERIAKEAAEAIDSALASEMVQEVGAEVRDRQ